MACRRSGSPSIKVGEGVCSTFCAKTPSEQDRRLLSITIALVVDGRVGELGNVTISAIDPDSDDGPNVLTIMLSCYPVLAPVAPLILPKLVRPKLVLYESGLSSHPKRSFSGQNSPVRCLKLELDSLLKPIRPNANIDMIPISLGN